MKLLKKDEGWTTEPDCPKGELGAAASGEPKNHSQVALELSM